MRFLIVDESGSFRAELALMLRERWPEAATDEWDPRTQGSPLPALKEGDFSAVLLDSQPAGEDGIAWVMQLRKYPQARLLAKKPEYRFQTARDLFAYIAI